VHHAIEALAALDLLWEAASDGRLGRVVIYDFPIPVGLKPDTAVVNLRIEPGYPETQIDTTYFYPAIDREARMATWPRNSSIPLAGTLPDLRELAFTLPVGAPLDPEAAGIPGDFEPV